jgi:hypothetical protein
MKYEVKKAYVLLFCKCSFEELRWRQTVLADFTRTCPATDLKSYNMSYVPIQINYKLAVIIAACVYRRTLLYTFNKNFKKLF